MTVEAICIASGPSLNDEDLEIARRWQGRDRLVIVVNTTFRRALWADVLFAMDARWWNCNPGDSEYPTFAAETKATFPGLRVTASHCYRRHGITFSRHVTFGNSGSGAIHWAYQQGAKRIMLLGYDCQRTGGRFHHHGDHPKPLANALSLPQWPDQFQRLANALKGKADIINCTRETALHCFPRMELEAALGACAEAA